MRRLLLFLAVFTSLPVASAAAQAPAGCTGNDLAADVSWDTGKGRIDLPSKPVVRVAHTDPSGCDVSNLTIRVALPGPDGQPSATYVTLADDVSFPRDMAPLVLSPAPWTVALNPGVTAATADVTWSGVARDVVDSPFSGAKRATLGIAAPKLGFTVTADPATGSAPLDITYRFRLTNEGTPPDPLTSVAVAHPNCTPVRQDGDTDGDNALDAGEVWTYACTHRFATAIEHTATSNATAISTSDGRAVTAPAVTTTVRTLAPAEPLTTSDVPATDTTPAAATPTAPEPAATPRPSARVAFTATGRFARPCRGRVALTLKAGTKTIARKSAKPTSTCRYRVNFDVARSRLGKVTRVTVIARLAKSTKTQRLPVPPT